MATTPGENHTRILFGAGLARPGVTPADLGWRTAGGTWRVRPVPPSPRNEDVVLAVDEPRHHVAFPGICRTRSGDLLIVYRHGKEHVDNEADVRLVRSSDGGRTWGAPEVIADDPLYDDRNAAITCLEDGTLVVCYDIYNLGEDRFSYFITSGDEGRTWSAPARIGDNPHFRTRSRMLELAPGRWLFPVYDCSGPEEGRGSYAVTYADGASLPAFISHLDPGLDDETAVERAPDGSLVAILRCCSAEKPPYHFQSVSRDEGRTWSPPQPTALAGRHDPADLCRLADGRLVCAYSFLNRKSERLALSRDGGLTWDCESSVSARAGDPRYPIDRAYASCTLVDEHTVGVCLYETRAYPEGGRILFCRVPIAEFDRAGVPALACDRVAPEAVAFLPGEVEAGSVAMRYRFTGSFGDQGGEIALLTRVDAPDDYLAFSLSLAPGGAARESNQVALLRARPGCEPEVLAAGPAQGGWFDDGDEHTLSLSTTPEGEVAAAIDGAEQLRARVPAAEAGGVGVLVRDATAAVYEVSVQG